MLVVMALLCVLVHVVALPRHLYPTSTAQATPSDLKAARHDDKAYVFSFKSSAHLWHHYEHREAYQKLLEDIAVLRRLAARLSSRAEMVGAVRQVRTSWCINTYLDCTRSLLFFSHSWRLC